MLGFLFKISFVFPGIYFSILLYVDFKEYSGSDSTMLFLWAASLYQLVYIVSFGRDEGSSLLARAAKWALYYAITLETVIFLNWLRVFDSGLFIALFGYIGATSSPTANGVGGGVIATILTCCILYQVGYFVCRKLRR